MEERLTYIIGEAGVNHNGDPETALQLIEVAARVGVDAIKFQTFKADKLVTRTAPKADYQKQHTGEESQYEMLKKLELSYQVHHELVRECQNKKIEFLSTAFDQESLNFLVDDVGLDTLKIPSGEITNAPFLLAHARSGCRLIVSTGMTTLGEIEAALSVIAFGLIEGKKPGKAAFNDAYRSVAGQQALKNKVSLLHCTTEYPTPMQDVNLLAMDTMRQAYALNVGISDHSAGIIVPIAAVARGASIVEKHFTLDKKLTGPDHRASLEADELSAMVDAIRNVESALGSGLKCPAAPELDNQVIARKSLVASRSIRIGECFSETNLTPMRPGGGISPMEYWNIIGRLATRNFAKGDQICV